MRTRLILALAATLAGCGGQIGDEADSLGSAYSGGSGNGNNLAALTPAQLLGREVWLKATFGGQKMFSVLLPSLPEPNKLHLAFDKLLTTPRAQRFAEWGVLNDPDCTDGDASTYGMDKCPPDTYPTIPGMSAAQVQAIMGAKSGIVGVRTFPNPLFGATTLPPGVDPVVATEPVLVGVSCASCHAGWDPENPPASTASPTWANIHLTAGNQYIQIGKLFGGNLSESDPRWQVFHSWKAGTVDTTAIESDHINNPGIITQFWNVPSRPFFNLTYNNQAVYDPPVMNPAIVVHRGGQGGEDDLGCQMAALRVYFNIGMCAQECMLPHLTNGPGGGQTPIDLAACAASCSAYVPAAQLVNPMCDFMATTTSPKAPGNAAANSAQVARGAVVFKAACASCHSNGQANDTILSDDKLHPAKGPLANELAGEIGTNSCRSKSTNWQTGQIWAAFSSEEQRNHTYGQPGSYRDVPLAGIWATAPFFHNNQLGPQPDLSDPNTITASGRLDLYHKSMDLLLNPWKRTPVVETTTKTISIPTPYGFSLTLPAGTPVGAFANLNPANPLQNFCPDFVENEGHYFGALLSPSDKAALTEYLKTK